jgi:hypothetical protein
VSGTSHQPERAGAPHLATVTVAPITTAIQGDAEILVRTGPDPEFAKLAEHAAGMPSTLP